MENFKKDLVRKELIPIKILMFLIYGGQATLYPYFTVHLKSLGVSIRQTSIIFAVQPVIALVVAPVVGMLADKIGNFKLIFSFFLTFSAITANLLLFVPEVTQREKLLYFNLKCDSSSETRIELNKDISCEIKRDINRTYSNMTVRLSCDDSCPNMDESFFPLYLKGGDTDCQCPGSKEEKCSNIDKSMDLDLYLNIQDLYNSSSTFIADESFQIVSKDATYKGLHCCAQCKANCTFVTQNPVSDCLDFPENDDFGPTFWSYLGIRLVVTLGIGLVNGLFDAASMTIIQDLNADVGFQRFWSTVAMCMFAPISGYLVDSLHSYKPCFLMYGALYLIAAITSLKLDLSMKLPSDNPLKNLAILLRNPEVILLLIQIAVLGICWGFLENFLFWFLESTLGSNNLIMGLTVTVGSGTGLFMALIATWCTRKLGYVNVIIVAFAAYTVRFIGYSIAQDAYTCLIFEMMENFTVTLLTVGVTLYCTELASMEMLTTIMTLWNGLHIISGRAFGSLLGGFLVREYGFRTTFQYFAYISASFGIFYAVVYITWLRKRRELHRKKSEEDRRNSSAQEEKEEEAMKSEAFTSLAMHCSLDSYSILRYVPESPTFEFRRRAMSHTPVIRSNSFGQRRIPRHAASFSEGNKVPAPLSVILESPVDENPNFNFPTTWGKEVDAKYETRF